MDGLSLRRLVTRLLMLVMFAFGFALVPIYDVMCKAFGINGKTGGQYEGSQVRTRRVRCGCSSVDQRQRHGWEFHSRPTRSRSTRVR
jgi:cytochrome c oxidase assembly protein subunit 11